MAILRFMQEYITLHEDSTHNFGVDKVQKVKPESGITWANITPCELASSSAVISTIHPNKALTIKCGDIDNALSSESSTTFVTGMSAVDATTQESACSSNCSSQKQFDISTYHGLERPWNMGLI